MSLRQRADVNLRKIRHARSPEPRQRELARDDQAGDEERYETRIQHDVESRLQPDAEAIAKMPTIAKPCTPARLESPADPSETLACRTRRSPRALASEAFA